jgi:hypothetical protein
MPIEIKELHIRVAVNTPSGEQSAGAPTAADRSADMGTEEAKEALVAECVEQVLQIMRHKTER